MARHFFASGKGLLSNEEESLEVSAGDDGSQEALASLEAEGQANDAAADAAANEAIVADGLEGVVALENMRLTLRAANENGGMDRFGALAVKQHADFVLRKFLKSDDGLTMPSNESFGGAGSRVGSGVLTMESIASKAKEIWAAILKFLKKMKDKVMAWINKIFGAAEKLAKRADAIKSRADKLSGTAKEKTFENDAIYNALAVAQTFDAGKLKTSMNTVAKVAENMVVDSAMINKSVNDALTDMSDVTQDNATAKIGEARAKIDAITGKLKPGITTGVDLPGNVTFRVMAKVGTGAAARMEGFGLPSNGAKAKEGQKVPTLDKATISDLCTTVKNIASSLVATRTMEKSSAEAYKKLTEFGDKQSKESDVADVKDIAAVTGSGKPNSAAISGDSVRTAHGAVVALFKELSGAIDGPVKSLAGYCMKTAGKTLDYCDASLGQYA